MVFPEYRPVEYPVGLTPATWALTIAFFYYLMIGLGISKNSTRTNIWFSISCIYVLVNIFVFKNWVSGYGNIVSASLPFSIGAMLFYHKQNCYTVIKKISNHYIKIILVLFTLNLVIPSLSGIYLLDIHWKIAIIGTYLNLGLSSLLIIVLLFNGKSLLNRDIDQFLGDLSYPVYIFHFSGALIASWLIFDSVESGLSINGFITFLFGSLITIIVSVIVNITINKNIKRIRTLIKNKKEVVKQTV
jgi:peptidoglycan/LPS O-acetylase OafA/YrhL